MLIYPRAQRGTLVSQYERVEAAVGSLNLCIMNDLHYYASKLPDGYVLLQMGLNLSVLDPQPPRILLVATPDLGHLLLC